MKSVIPSYGSLGLVWTWTHDIVGKRDPEERVVKQSCATDSCTCMPQHVRLPEEDTYIISKLSQIWVNKPSEEMHVSLLGKQN